MRGFNNDYGFDFIKLFIYLSFIFAIIFYYLSRVNKTATIFLVLGLLFIIAGIVLIIIKLYEPYSLSHSLYKNALNDKKNELLMGLKMQNVDYVKELKLYKKTHLRKMRFTNIKYVLIMSVLALLIAYLIYVIIRLIFG